jgi:hypothetical protein
LSRAQDDDLAVDFVTAAANLRSLSYDIPCQTLFAAKVGISARAAGPLLGSVQARQYSVMILAGYGRQHHPRHCHYKRHLVRAYCGGGTEAAGRRAAAACIPCT